MTLIADLFPKLRTPKNVVRYMYPLTGKVYFRNYALRKTWLDICQKSPVLKYPLTGNMVNGFKHCSHLNHSTVTIFSYHFEGN